MDLLVIDCYVALCMTSDVECNVSLVGTGILKLSIGVYCHPLTTVCKSLFWDPSLCQMGSGCFHWINGPICLSCNLLI